MKLIKNEKIRGLFFEKHFTFGLTPPKEIEILRTWVVIAIGAFIVFLSILLKA